MAEQKSFSDLPLATSPLDTEERAKWLAVIDPLLSYGGSPGDWGRQSKLGRLVQALHGVRQEILDGK